MFSKFIVAAVSVFQVVSAVPIYNPVLSNSLYGLGVLNGLSQGSNDLALESPISLVGGYNQKTGEIVPAAILSNHHLSYYDIPRTSLIKPTTIDVPANVLPLNFLFRSASSLINVDQKHQGSPGSVRESASTDEPHRLLHTVTKPIIQEIREIISPYRKITQTVNPVYEEVKTLVARGYGAHTKQQFGYASSLMIPTKESIAEKPLITAKLVPLLTSCPIENLPPTYLEPPPNMTKQSLPSLAPKLY